MGVLLWTMFMFFLALSLVLGQKDSQTCTTYDGRFGVCKPVSKCEEAIESIQEGEYPKVCWWFGKSPVVCCPETENLNSFGQKSERKCAEFHTLKQARFSLRERNLVKPAVVGGINSLAKEFPHMAALGYGKQGSIKWQCGGTLISEQYVLTAAHCLHSRDLGEVKWVRLGDLNLNDDYDNADPQEFAVVERIKHPDYKPPSQYNDIALLKLSFPVNLTAYVKPACLPVNIDYSSSQPIATGWGRTAFGGDSSNILQKVKLSFFDIDTCKKIYEDTPIRKLSKGIDEESQLCAGSFSSNKDTCQGDSGGPLQVYNKKYLQAYYIIGITSFGKACGLARSPGVYTKVSHYISWIEGVAFS